MIVHLHRVTDQVIAQVTPQVITLLMFSGGYFEKIKLGRLTVLPGRLKSVRTSCERSTHPRSTRKGKTKFLFRAEEKVARCELSSTLQDGLFRILLPAH